MTDYEYCLNFFDGSKYFYDDGKLSNIGGPAVVHGKSGEKEYWIDGIQYESMEQAERKHADLNHLLDKILKILK